jgi:REP element-mobilizing transposase RayT
VNAEIVQEQLISGHGDLYRLIEWSVMPNHVHVLIGMKEDSSSLPTIVQKWKGASAIQINRHHKRSGTLWMRDYFDRFIRDEDHFLNARIYIRENPVKAGLCEDPEDWPFSSSGTGWKS